MLQLRPNCELCDADLPPEALNARICTYECAFCASCVEDRLHNVCPNCGGGFAPRPVRPMREYRKGTGLSRHPASSARVRSQHGADEIAVFVNAVKDIPPGER